MALEVFRTAADIFLNESGGKEWRAVEDPVPVLSKISEKEFESFIERRVDRGVVNKVIIPSDSVNPWIKKRIERAEEELFDILVVSPEEYPIRSSYAVSGDMVLIFSMQSVPYGVLIKSPEIATTFDSVHRMVWDRYRR